MRRLPPSTKGAGARYRWVDIESTEGAEETMLGLNGGVWRAPTILMPDGSVLVEPSNSELKAQVGRLAA